METELVVYLNLDVSHDRLDGIKNLPVVRGILQIDLMCDAAFLQPAYELLGDCGIVVTKQMNLLELLLIEE